MSILQMVEGMVGTQAETQIVGELAQRMGIDPAMAQSALAALVQAHPQPGDTVATASAQSGIPQSTLNDAIGHLGGEGGLGALIQSMGGQTAANGATGGLSGVLGGLMGGRH